VRMAVRARSLRGRPGPVAWVAFTVASTQTQYGRGTTGCSAPVAAGCASLPGSTDRGYDCCACDVQAGGDRLMALEIKRSDDGPTAVFRLTGEFASEETAAVRAVMYDAVTDAAVHEVVVDLAGVTFIDSTGVGTLALTHRVGGATCVVRVVNPNPAVRRVLEMTGVLGMLSGD